MSFHKDKIAEIPFNPSPQPLEERHHFEYNRKLRLGKGQVVGDSIRRILSRMAGFLLPAYLCIHPGTTGTGLSARHPLESTWYDSIRSRGNVYLGKEKLPLAISMC